MEAIRFETLLALGLLATWTTLVIGMAVRYLWKSSRNKPGP